MDFAHPREYVPNTDEHFADLKRLLAKLRYLQSHLASLGLQLAIVVASTVIVAPRIAKSIRPCGSAATKR